MEYLLKLHVQTVERNKGMIVQEWLIPAPTISAARLMTSIHDDIDTEINNIDNEFHNVDDHC